MYAYIYFLMFIDVVWYRIELNSTDSRQNFKFSVFVVLADSGWPEMQWLRWKTMFARYLFPRRLPHSTALRVRCAVCLWLSVECSTTVIESCYFLVWYQYAKVEFPALKYLDDPGIDSRRNGGKSSTKWPYLHNSNTVQAVQFTPYSYF